MRKVGRKTGTLEWSLHVQSVQIQKLISGFAEIGAVELVVATGTLQRPLRFRFEVRR